jgi:hypothetical protein
MNNVNSLYFDTRTQAAGGDFNKLYPGAGNGVFRAAVATAFLCTGVHCIPGSKLNGWGCDKGDSINCYNAEHIIAKANKEILPECPVSTKDVGGNLIMAWGVWNNQISNRHMNEKVAIYGRDIVKLAYDSVYLACKGAHPVSYPAELCLGPDPVTDSIALYICIAVVLIFAVVFGIHLYKNRETICAEPRAAVQLNTISIVADDNSSSEQESNATSLDSLER